MNWFDNISIQPIIEYVVKNVGQKLFGQPWTIVGILATSLVAYFTLLHHLGDALKGQGPNINKIEKVHRFKTIEEARQTLKALCQIALTTLALLFIRLFLPYVENVETPSVTATVIFAMSIITPVNFFGLGFIGIVIEEFVFECKREDAEMACQRLDAVVYLKKRATPLKGTLLDLRLLNGSKYFPFRQEDGNLINIETSNVASIFLQEGYSRRRLLSPRRFTEGPKNLKIVFPHEESFPDTPYFRKNGFTILKISKATTNSHFAIIDQSFVK